MSFNPGIKPGDIITNQGLTNIFKCSPQGGMRRSLKTNTLVIVSDKTTSFYDDVWKRDILHYTGMGQKGNQSVDFMQNKTLAYSGSNGVAVHLFEVFTPRKYLYRGRVKLVEKPYQAPQKDYEGVTRQVWLFPVRIFQEEQTPIPEEVFIDNQAIKEKAVKRKTTTELLRTIRESTDTQKRPVLSNQYVRDPVVSELAKRRANGKCQLCKQDAPFLNRAGEPYLETHHIDWLSRNGLDNLENTVALCPNCHRKMHILDRPIDKDTLKRESHKPV
ncbi:MAG: HNH endonuclease [Candidatus Bathyarchaeota archaeon]|nr:HNH endonuclease [Candidatus Bathyarchaeota archaeon]